MYITVKGKVKASQAAIQELREAMIQYKQAVNTAVKLLAAGVEKGKVKKWLGQASPLMRTLTDAAVDYARQMLKTTHSKEKPTLKKPLLKLKLRPSKIITLNSENSVLAIALHLFKEKSEQCYHAYLPANKYIKPPKPTRITFFEKRGKILVALPKAITLPEPKQTNIYIGVDLNANFRHAAIAAIGVYDPEAKKLTITHVYNLADHIKYGVAKIPKLNEKISEIHRSGNNPRKYYAKITRIKKDFAHKIAAKLAKLAEQHNASYIFFEDLRALKPSKHEPKHLRKTTSKWIRKLIIKYARYKACQKGTRTAYVNPAETSKRCPFCRREIPKNKPHYCEKTWIHANHALAAVNILRRGVAKIYKVDEEEITVTVTPRCPRGGGVGVPRIPEARAQCAMKAPQRGASASGMQTPR